jgi:hypothetical protein
VVANDHSPGPVSRATRQAAKSGASATSVPVPRSASSGASVPPRTPVPSNDRPELSTPTNATRSGSQS